MKKLLYFLLPLVLVFVLNSCGDDAPATPTPAFNNLDDVSGSVDDEIILDMAHTMENWGKYKVTINGKEMPYSVSYSDDKTGYKIPFKAGSGTIQVELDNGTLINGPKLNYLPKYLYSFYQTDGGVGRALAKSDLGMVSWANEMEKSFYIMNTKGLEANGSSLDLTVNYTKMPMTLPSDAKSLWSLRLSGLTVTDNHDFLFYQLYSNSAPIPVNQLLITDPDLSEATFATSGNPSSKLEFITDMESDSQGENVYFVENQRPYIRKIQSYDDSKISTVAGAASAGHVDAKGTAAQFENITDLAYDRVHNKLYVADNHCIRMVTPDGTVTTVAGGTSSGDQDGALSQARFNAIQAICLGEDGQLYVADGGNGKMKVIDKNFTSVTTLPGVTTDATDDGLQMEVDKNGFIYGIMDGKHAILTVWIPESAVTEAQYTQIQTMKQTGDLVYVILKAQ